MEPLYTFEFELASGLSMEVLIPASATASELKIIRKKVDRYISLLIANSEPRE